MDETCGAWGAHKVVLMSNKVMLLLYLAKQADGDWVGPRIRSMEKEAVSRSRRFRWVGERNHRG